MKLETKFSLKDTVYFIESNSVRSGQVVSIDIEIKSDGIQKNKYYNSDSQNIYTEDKLFTSKSELLKSL